MAKYFSKFPQFLYNGKNDTTFDLVTGITARWSFQEKLKQNTSAYYEYSIVDGETPEIIAHKIYGSAEYHWVVLMFNDIVDPQFDWPMQYENLIQYMNKKYYDNADTANTGVTGSLWAQNNIKQYYIVEQNILTGPSSIVTDDNRYSNTYISCDYNTYNNVGTYFQTTANTSVANNVSFSDGTNLQITYSTDTQTYYDYEIELNETKRNIKILKKDFLSSVISELNDVMQT